MDTSKKEQSTWPSPLKHYSYKKIQQWGNSLTSAETKADLALLRKFVGKSPEQVIEPWPVILDGEEKDLQEILNPLYVPKQNKLSGLTPGEIALYYTFCLYAIHQRSRTDKSMFEANVSVGQAFHQLAIERARKNGSLSDESEKIFKRLKAMAGKKELKAMIPDLRGLVALLNEAKIPMDYAALAVDLLRLQSPKTKNQVLIRWINDFNRAKSVDEIQPSEEKK